MTNKSPTEERSTYITTPIFYVNDKPHIGHAYTNIAADCIARLHSLNGSKARMQTGTDEHGQKVLKSATDKGLNPMQFCNKVSEEFYKLAIQMNCIASYPEFDRKEHFNLQNLSKTLYQQREKLIRPDGTVKAETPEEKEHNKVALHYTHQGHNAQESFTHSSLYGFGENYIRTTEGRDQHDGSITQQSRNEGRHVKAVEHFWEKLVANGWIYKGQYSGWYAIRDEAFYSESELVDGKAPTGAEVVWKEEEAYFFKLSKFQSVLLNTYRTHSIIRPHEKFTEIISFLSGIDFQAGIKGETKENHLQDLCVSRVDLPWGIPVPNEPRHSIYVWIDALVNYLSAIHYPAQYARDFWEEAKTIHIVGKDIIRFHCIYWPALLIAEKYTEEEFSKLYTGGKNEAEDKKFIQECTKVMPKEIFAHGWWTNKGEKISKSLGNVINPQEEIEAIMENFAIDESFASDYFRFSLISAMPFGSDGNYDRSVAWSNIDATLCGSIGNLINRVFALINKNCNLQTFFTQTEEEIDQASATLLTESHCNIYSEVQNLIEQMEQLISNCNLQGIIKAAAKIADRCNAYIEAAAPWALAKTNPQKATTTLQVLYVQIILVMQSLRFIVPNFAERFFQHVNLDQELRRVPTKQNGAHDAELRQVNGTSTKSTAHILQQLLKLYKPQTEEIITTYMASPPIFFQKTVQTK